MLLTDHCLQQIDEEDVRSLSGEALVELAVKLLLDLKAARERLNQNANNSSRPPSSEAPWVGSDPDDLDVVDDTQDRHDAAGLTEDQPVDDPAEGSQPGAAVNHSNPEARSNKGGKPQGAPGYGRTQPLPVTDTVPHRPEYCERCGRPADEPTTQKAWTAHYTVDVEVGDESMPGLQVTQTKHLYYESLCACGHRTRAWPFRAEDDEEWQGIGLSEWRLVGETLCALIIAQTLRYRLSRRKVQEFLRDWLGLRLAIGTIQQCIEEGGRATEPVEDSLVEDIVKSELLHVDETSHKEHGHPLWLWVFTNATTVLFLIGYRTREMLDNVLRDRYTGWLMSDGYSVYRHLSRRLRCWAHLSRKARGLTESLDQEARRFGEQTALLIKMLTDAVYRAREGPTQDLKQTYREPLEAFRALCQQYSSAKHEKARALAVEFLSDWDAIFRVLEHPHLPLTNNEAEIALRHWVILRRMTYGTRTPQGSRAFALLASIIDTCRERNLLPWPYVAQVIAARRRGDAVPPLPTAAS